MKTQSTPPFKFNIGDRVTKRFNGSTLLDTEVVIIGRGQYFSGTIWYIVDKYPTLRFTEDDIIIAKPPLK